MTKFQSAPASFLDLGFQALSDATRRAVIARLALGEASVSELAEPFDMALPTFLRHVTVLETAGLVTTRKRGRVRTCRLQAERLAKLNRWIADYETQWSARLDRLDTYLQPKDT